MIRTGSSLVSIFLLVASASTLVGKDTRLVLIVRHAEKGSTPADDPPLTDEGQARAHLLARMCREIGVTAIFTSEFRRSQQTAEPLARELGLTPNVITALDVKALTAAIKTRGGNTSFVVAHSNTIPLIIRELGGGGVEPIAETEFDDLFVVILPFRSPAKILRLKYGSGVSAPLAGMIGECIPASCHRGHEEASIGGRVRPQDVGASGALSNCRRDVVFADQKGRSWAPQEAANRTRHRTKIWRSHDYLSARMYC